MNVAQSLASRGIAIRFLSIALTAVALVVGVTTWGAAISPDDVKLSLRPVNTGELPYWKLRMRPGTSQELAADLVNAAPSPIDATTFVSNMSTGANGSDEISESPDNPTGATRWVKYPTKELTLPGTSSERTTFFVRVPRSAKPGDYIAAVVLQNSEPAVPEGQQGGVQLGQTLRQAVAISIRVPGPYNPQLDIGEASLQAGPTFSLISVGVANTGNQNLSPSYTMVVRDEASVQVLQDDGQIDNFYAGAETAIRGRLEGFLAPGAYSVDLTLTDKRLDEPVVATGLPLVVAEPPSDAGDNPEIVNQESNPLWIAGALGLLILLALLLLLFVRRSRHRGPAEPPAPVMPPPSGPSWFPTDSMRSTTVAEVLPVVGAELRGVNGNTTAELHKLARLFPGEVGALSAATRQEEIPAVLQTQSSAVLVTPELFSHLVAAYPADRLPTLIAVPEPLLTAQRVAQALR